MTTPGATRLHVGLMSGTSCDGVDAVVVAVRGGPAGVEPIEVDVLEHHHVPYEPDFRARLLALPDAGVDEPELGTVIGCAVCQLHSLYPDILQPKTRRYGYIWGVYVERTRREPSPWGGVQAA